jgi:hypothetical protein
MWWDTGRFAYVWHDFQQQQLQQLIRRYRGDQDYLDQIIPNSQVRFLDPERIKSWRWQCLDGGYKLNRSVQATDTATVLPSNTDVMIFHGQPKPDQIKDPVITHHWQ